ncbi:hypothetical protein ceV_238 [Chrysochromulina ericina virus CeV-01B]|uniref:Uncharacterized protein n=1 Tax=Chrysochromulina ericina virus CeV-01B TaxID=3070830 RepID=A0A0N9QYF4_9VIRU|nr:hypothetical protein ceV_238 [Chrysochromulina ericina virus]ALH23144.1 hypothetical protein ceV_238 [Chrysochromulina ericina virus CeV-01B]
MSLEDNFHINSHNNYKTLIARFKVNKLFIDNLKDNIKSDRFNNVLNLISDYNNYLQIYTGEDILNNKHPDIEVQINNNILEFHINHSKIGGLLLIKLFECIINSKSRKILKTDILHGLLYSVYDIKNIYNLIKSPCNKVYNDKLLHYTKTYNIVKTFNISRVTQSYYELFFDVLHALDKSTIKIGIPIPFDKYNIINNVGIVIFDFNKTTSIKELDNILKNNINLAYATNVINLYGNNFTNLLNIDNFKARTKLDIICSTFISDNSAIPGDFSLQPTVNIYEGAYISLYIRLSGTSNKKEATAYAAVTSNNSKQKWNNLKFIKY